MRQASTGTERARLARSVALVALGLAIQGAIIGLALRGGGAQGGIDLAVLAVLAPATANSPAFP